MKKSVRSSPVAAGLLCLAFSVATAAAQKDVVQMEAVIESQRSQGQFMGAVLVARQGKVLLNKGYGKANLEWQAPHTPQSRFKLGSMTKQFTAASILLLEERGKLKIDEPISKYVPDAPPSWAPITFFNLLTHTAGMREITALPDFATLERFPITPEKLVERLRELPLDFAPGTDFRYSNAGYILLGYLIEKISGQTYRQFVQDNLFGPLGMKDSGYDSNVEVIERHAAGYAPQPGGFKPAAYVDMTVPFAAGALYSTTGDMLRWQEGLHGGKLLSPASLAKMQTPNDKDYAFGLMVDPDANSNKVIWHCGAIDGFAACGAYVPVEKLSVIVLSNVEGRAALALMQEILKIAQHEPLTPKW